MEAAQAGGIPAGRSVRYDMGNGGKRQNGMGNDGRKRGFRGALCAGLPGRTVLDHAGVGAASAEAVVLHGKQKEGFL